MILGWPCFHALLSAILMRLAIQRDLAREYLVSLACSCLRKSTLSQWCLGSPGVACDVPAHIYCYTFEPEPTWTEVRATLFRDDNATVPKLILPLHSTTRPERIFWTI